ncbi:MAG: VWA domain-containing protein [Polyangiaceae bacterium]|nr:VWA domain-containing protein [Polyangiaceae bacterium]
MKGAALLLWSFLGIPWEVLAPWAALSSVLLILFYFLKTRLPVARVPWLGLFVEEKRERKSALAKVPLRRIFSLFVQLGILALLFAALSEPEVGPSPADRSHLLVLIDTSSSMQSLVGDQTRLEVAQEMALQEVESLQGQGVVLVGSLGARPKVESYWSTDLSEVRGSIVGLRAVDSAGHLEGLANWLTVLLKEKKPARVLFFSDKFVSWEEISGEEDSPGFSWEPYPVVPRSQASDEFAHWGLSSFSVRRYPLQPSKIAAEVELKNTTPTPLTLELRVASLRVENLSLENLDLSKNHERASLMDRQAAFESAAQVIELQSVKLAPLTRQRISFEALPGEHSAFIASVEAFDQQGAALPQDAFPLDNQAYAVVPPLSPRRILVVGEPSTYLQAALLLEADWSITEVADFASAPEGPFELTIFVDDYAEELPEVGSYVFWGSSAPKVFEQGKMMTMVGFDEWERSSPFFRSLDPYDIQILKAFTLIPREKDQVLGRSKQGALLMEGQQGEARWLALGFRPHESDFVLRSEFPLFVRNLVDALAPSRSDSSSWNLRAGRAQPVSTRGWAKPSEGELWFLKGAGVERPLSSRGGYLSLAIDRVGFYQIDTDDEKYWLAVSAFDTSEAHALPTTAPQRGIQQAEATQVENPSSEQLSQEPAWSTWVSLRKFLGEHPWSWLAFAALVLSAFEWLSWHRRWTV